MFRICFHFYDGITFFFIAKYNHFTKRSHYTEKSIIKTLYGTSHLVVKVAFVKSSWSKYPEVCSFYTFAINASC